MKKIIMIGIALIMLFLTGCSRPQDQEVDIQIAEATGETLIEAIKTKDADLLKTVLSEKALATDDLDEGIEYLFNFVDEEIRSVEELEFPEYGTFERGTSKKSLGFFCRYRLFTSDDKAYLLYFCYNAVQDFDETELGVNRIMILVDDDSPYEYKVITEYTRAGIVTPDWSDDD